MAVYKLGPDADEWAKLSKALAVAKTPEMHVGLQPGDSVSATVDTNDPEFDIFLHIVHLDVGQGESTLIMLLCEPAICATLSLSPCILSILIDGGVTTGGGGMIARMLHLHQIDYLDAALISHFDKDHTEGITRILEEIDVEEEEGEQERLEMVVEANVGQEEEHKEQSETGLASPLSLPAIASIPVRKWKPVALPLVLMRIGASDLNDINHVKQTSVVEKLYDAFENSNVQGLQVEVGDVLQMDCKADQGLFKMTCIGANASADNAESSDDDQENENSVAWLLEFGKYTYYTAGDLPSPEELKLLPKITAPLTAMKCGHHGASTSTSKQVLEGMKPRLAFISAGKQEMFGHPTTDTMLRLRESPGIEAIFITNCFHNRPFLRPSYPAVLEGDLEDTLDQCSSTLSAWLRDMPELNGDEATTRKNDDHRPERVRVMRSEFADLIENFELNIKAYTTNTLTEISTFPAKLKAWGQKHKFGIADLKNGFQLQGARAQLKRDFTLKANDGLTAHLQTAAIHAKDLNSYRKAQDAAPQNPPQFYLAGGEKHLGNISLVMSKADANNENRVCWVSYPQSGEYLPFVFGDPALVDNTVRPGIWGELATETTLIALSPPKSPRKYATYVGKRSDDYRKKFPTQEDDMPVLDLADGSGGALATGAHGAPSSSGQKRTSDENAVENNPRENKRSKQTPEVQEEEKESFVEEKEGSVREDESMHVETTPQGQGETMNDLD
jgi:beta-lactamase superfamily II metal-dependent hydrolase